MEGDFCVRRKIMSHQ